MQTSGQYIMYHHKHVLCTVYRSSLLSVSEGSRFDFDRAVCQCDFSAARAEGSHSAWVHVWQHQQPCQGSRFSSHQSLQTQEHTQRGTSEGSNKLSLLLNWPFQIQRISASKYMPIGERKVNVPILYLGIFLSDIPIQDVDLCHVTNTECLKWLYNAFPNRDIFN